MRFKYLFILIILICVVPVNASLLSSNKKMIIEVIDQDMNPVENAMAKASFTAYPIDTKVDCVTSEAGKCVIERVSNEDGGIRVSKEGYYYSYIGIEFDNNSTNLDKSRDNIYKVILKKKQNPVSMYARNARGLKMPVYNEPIGFDLEVGDWVVPYGKGLVKDFIFTFKKNETNYTVYKSSFILQFSNDHDGFIEYFVNDENQSYYKWPFVAPTIGYINKISKYRENLPTTTVSDLKENVNYFFRVRTKVDEQGNIVSANYGKIDGEFRLGHSLGFTYYFNPDGTPNLEFDPEQNLFKFSRRERAKHRVQRP